MLSGNSSNLLHTLEYRRDSYGFALRPQHVQTFRQYASIYKEEEGERSVKWKNFLEQQDKYDLSCSSEEDDEEIFQAEATELEGVKGDPSGNRSDPDASTESDPQNDVQYSEEPKNEVPLPEEPDKNLDSPKQPVKEVQHSGNEQDLKTSVELEENSTSNKLQKRVKSSKQERKEEQLSKEKKTNKTHNWSSIRISLQAIERLMSLRVKNMKLMKEKTRNLNKDRFPSIEAIQSFRSENEEENGMHETSDDSANATIGKGTVNKGSQHPLCQWKEELDFLVRGGVPKDLRGEVWQAFAGVKSRRKEGYYEDLVSKEADDEEAENHCNLTDVCKKWKRQIEKDIPRTFPGHPALNDHGRDSLRRVLLAYARHNPSVGYCQAMNFFAGLLLLLMPEENAFWSLVGIIDDYFNGYYTEEMIESQVDQLVFEDLMRERFPKLVNHLDYLGVQVAWISGPWFLSIFINMLPWESEFVMFCDVILYEGNRVMLFRTALALMELYGPAIVTTKDAGDAMTLLQSLAGSTFDSSQLVFTACMGYPAINEARLYELREKHRPSVLEVVEERSKKGKVWKDSKGLASKLYSFKHEPTTLVEEKAIVEEEKSKSEPHTANLDDLLSSLNIDAELDSLPDLQEQVVWLKVELSRLLEEKRFAILRAEELETALMEIVKQDNRLQLSAKVEQLDQEVAELRQVLDDKKEQEAAMLKVLMRVEQEQRITEEARINAERDAAAQRYAVNVLQEKYEKAMSSIAEMEQRVIMAESMLEATLQYESGQARALSSPRSARTNAESPGRRIGRLKFGLGWRDRNKGKPPNEESSQVSVITEESEEGSN